jgi:hypothetical protein
MDCCHESPCIYMYSGFLVKLMYPPTQLNDVGIMGRIIPMPSNPVSYHVGNSAVPSLTPLPVAHGPDIVPANFCGALNKPFHRAVESVSLISCVL